MQAPTISRQAGQPQDLFDAVAVQLDKYRRRAGAKPELADARLGHRPAARLPPARHHCHRRTATAYLARHEDRQFLCVINTITLTGSRIRPRWSAFRAKARCSSAWCTRTSCGCTSTASAAAMPTCGGVPGRAHPETDDRPAVDADRSAAPGPYRRGGPGRRPRRRYRPPRHQARQHHAAARQPGPCAARFRYGQGFAGAAAKTGKQSILAPQLHGARGDPRSRMCSGVGRVPLRYFLCELLTGARPFVGGSAGELLRRHLEYPIPCCRVRWSGGSPCWTVCWPITGRSSARRCRAGGGTDTILARAWRAGTPAIEEQGVSEKDSDQKASERRAESSACTTITGWHSALSSTRSSFAPTISTPFRCSRRRLPMARQRS